MSSKVNQNQFDTVMKLVANRIKPMPEDMARYPLSADIVFADGKKEKHLSGEELTQAIRKAIREHFSVFGRNIQINVTQVPKPYIARAEWNKLVGVIHSVGRLDDATDDAEKTEFEAANKRAREFFENMVINFKGIRKTVKQLIDEQQDGNIAKTLRKNIEVILVNTLIEIRGNFPNSIAEDTIHDDVSFRQDFIALLKNLDKHIELAKEDTLSFINKEKKSSSSDTNNSNIVEMKAVEKNDASEEETEATFLSKIKHGQSKEPLKIKYKLEHDPSNNSTTYSLQADLRSLSTPDKSLIFAPKVITDTQVKPSEMVVFEMFIILMKKLQETNKPFEGQIHVSPAHISTTSIAKIAYDEYMQASYGKDAFKTPEIHGATKFSVSQLSENEKAIKDKMITILKHSSQIKAQEENVENLSEYKLK